MSFVYFYFRELPKKRKPPSSEFGGFLIVPVEA